MRSWLLVVMIIASPAWAQTRPKVVIDAPGPIAKAINAAIAKTYDPQPAKKPLSDVPLTKEIREACAPHGAIAVVLVRPAPGGYSIQVLSASDGTPLGTFGFNAAAKKPLKSLPKRAAAELLTTLQEARPAASTLVATATPVAEPTPGQPTKRDEPSRHAPEPTKPAPVASRPEPTRPTEVAAEPAPSAPPDPRELRTAFRASLGFRGVNRRLAWDSSKSDALSGYDVPFSPAIAVDLTWFPAAPLTTGFISNLGATIQGDIGVGILSTPREDPTQFGTSSARFRLAALVRLPFGKTFDANAGLGYSSQTFAVSALSTNGLAVRPAMPGVAFNGPRVAIGVRLNHLGPVSIDVTGGFVIAIGKGELASDAFFPKSSAIGVDAAAGVSLELVSHFEARIGFDYSRYFITPNAVDDPLLLQAKRGTDQYISGSASLVFVL